MFGNGNNNMMGGNYYNNPFSTMNLDELQRNYQMQMERLNNIKATQQASIPILEEINRALASMSSEEQTLLIESHEYQLAKETYETGFLGFLSGKFSNEYIATPEGKMSAEGLLNTIKQSKDKIAYEAKVKREKMDQMLSLLENDPEIRKRYNELMGLNPTPNNSGQPQTVQETRKRRRTTDEEITE
jgi:hypothetical protein